ncbi:MAG: hypothetical protein HN350_17185 [Phycisphaerales bacterium]|jgi:Tfp pilus assembly protein PilX|nr:hypothetical protein [Phycisphaerales bacterium]
MYTRTRIDNKNCWSERRPLRSRRGVAYLFSLAMLALMTTMAVALMASTNLNLSRGQHMKDSLAAQLSAESGLQFVSMNFDKIRMPEGTNEATFATNLAAAIGEVLNETSNLCGGVVTCDGTTITIPKIIVGDSSFTCTVTILAPDVNGTPQCRVSSLGVSGLASRTVSLDMQMTGRAAGAFDYAIASKGGIYVSGNAEINGMNMPDEASVLSVNQNAIAISIGGSATIGGDLYLTAEDDGSLDLTGGGLSVGGESDINVIRDNNVHWLEDEPSFPELNLAPFEALAETATVIDASTDVDGKDLVFNNVRIAAGTNPEFKQDTVINGLLYIEAPNEVTFKSKVILNAIVVTEDGNGVTGASTLDFKSQVTVPGVDALPDTEEFADVKTLRGTAILAPGFGVQFRGQVNSINGTIAADQFSFLGNSSISGDVSGTIIGLSSKDLVMSGNATILVNKEAADDTPAGFVHFQGVAPVGNTYSEGD